MRQWFFVRINGEKSQTFFAFFAFFRYNKEIFCSLFVEKSAKMPRNVKRKTVHHLTRPNVLSFIAYCLILFFGATIVANINPEANSEYTKDRAKKNGLMMQWVFIDEN